MIRRFRFLPILLIILFLCSACSKQEENPPAEADSSTSANSTSNEQTNSNQPPSEKTQELSSSSNELPTEPEKDNSAEPKNSVSNTETGITTSTPQSESQTASTSTAHEESLSLARKSGCLACHAIDKKIVGPAWKDVAKRYKGDSDAKARLITKVSKGGSGNWKDVVGSAAMPPYSPRVSNDNIAKLVEFVLSLENE